MDCWISSKFDQQRWVENVQEVNLVDCRSTSAKTQHPHLGIKLTFFIFLGVVDFFQMFSVSVFLLLGL